MARAGAGKPLVFDTSVFHRFYKAGNVLVLASHFQALKVSCEITAEVRDELRDAGIMSTLTMLGWPEEVTLPAELRPELLRRMRASQTPDDHPLKNAGEISTALYANHVGGRLVVGEDTLLKNMCREFQLRRISTAQVIVEMVGAGSLSYADGWRVWNSATPPDVGEDVFQERLRQAGHGGLIP